jgi:hypothetical protein
MVVMGGRGAAVGAGVVAVVAGALVGAAEDVVGFGEGDEARRGGGVRGVLVGMVLFGEGVEGSVNG